MTKLKNKLSATFLVNLLRGEEIAKYMKKASQISAYVVSQMEAIPEDA